MTEHHAPIRVLCIDDNPAELRLLREHLTSFAEPFEICGATTLAYARQWLARESFEVILLDLNLGESQGLDTLRLLGEVPAPVIVLTGMDEALGAACIANGANDFLLKNELRPELLKRSIRYAIERDHYVCDFADMISEGLIEIHARLASLASLLEARRCVHANKPDGRDKPVSARNQSGPGQVDGVVGRVARGCGVP